MSNKMKGGLVKTRDAIITPQKNVVGLDGQQLINTDNAPESEFIDTSKEQYDQYKTTLKARGRNVLVEYVRQIEERSTAGVITMGLTLPVDRRATVLNTGDEVQGLEPGTEFIMAVTSDELERRTLIHYSNAEDNSYARLILLYEHEINLIVTK